MWNRACLCASSAPLASRTLALFFPKRSSSQDASRPAYVALLLPSMPSGMFWSWAGSMPRVISSGISPRTHPPAAFTHGSFSAFVMPTCSLACRSLERASSISRLPSSAFSISSFNVSSWNTVHQDESVPAERDASGFPVKYGFSYWTAARVHNGMAAFSPAAASLAETPAPQQRREHRIKPHTALFL